jgi:hypothetical protein
MPSGVKETDELNKAHVCYNRPRNNLKEFNMPLPAFDTHAFVKRLKQAGFNEEQAEAQAELQAQVLSSLVTEKLATKDDLLRLENETKQEFISIKNEMRQGFIRSKGEFNQLKWMLGFLLAGVMTALLKLFLHV